MEKRRKRQERRRIRRLKIRTLFMLSFTLIFNAYAWFAYVTTVETNMTVHVESWSVNFTVDDEAVEKEILFNVESAYPGMESLNRTVEVSNNGQKVADIKYIITEARVLNTTYIVKDQLSKDELNSLTGDEIVETTSDELIRMFEEDYPFKLVLSCDSESNSESLATGEEAKVSLDFEWPYDGDDENDTKYGVDSYKYYQDNGKNEPAIQIKVKLIVTQHKDST